MSFTTKRLRVTFTLATTNGTFGTSGNNTLTVEGLRMVADIQHAGGMMMPEATVSVFGMLQSDMNQLTALAWGALQVERNTIIIEAADDSGNWSQVFVGQIIDGWADYHGMPEAYFHVRAQVAFDWQIKAADPSSFTGGGDVAQIMSGLAAKMGYAFVNYGVQAQLSNAYLPGTLLEQARSVAKAANIDLYIDGQTLAITPKNSPRGTPVALIGPQSGLVGYPTFDNRGVGFMCEYNPALVFGGQVQLDTEVLRAQGLWRIYDMSHQLSSNMPDGAWFTQVKATDVHFDPVQLP